MSVLPGLGGAEPPAAPDAELRGWVRRAFGLDDGASILLTELRCHEAGCPPVETVVLIFGEEGEEEHRLHLPMAEVTEAHVWQLAAGDHGCCR